MTYCSQLDLGSLNNLQTRQPEESELEIITEMKNPTNPQPDKTPFCPPLYYLSTALKIPLRVISFLKTKIENGAEQLSKGFPFYTD